MYPAFGWSVELRAIMDISARIDADYGDCGFNFYAGRTRPTSQSSSRPSSISSST
jgi:hypothetical protein